MGSKRARRGKTRARRTKKLGPKKIIIFIIIIIMLLFFSSAFALSASVSNKVLSRVTVNGVDVANLTIDEMYEKLKDELEARKSKNITLRYEEYESTISLEQLEVNYKVEDAVNKAYKIGRSKNIIISNFQIISNLLFGSDIEENIEINEEELEKAIQDIEVKMPNVLVESSYYIEGDQLIITNGKPGLKLKQEELKEILISQIKEQIKGKDIATIEIPIEMKEPEKINIAKIYEEIYKEPKDAYFDEQNKKLSKEENGVDFAISQEKIEQMLQEQKEEYIIPLKIKKPIVTVATLAEENNFFPETLAKFTTRYDETALNRANNIKLSAEKIDGTILMPGEVFSYNKIVGERTIKAGYKEAAVYVGGKVVKGIGGGICQVSSTLYNAVLLANLEIMERRNHYFMTAYVSASRDATVSYGSIDFKFKNTRTYPIKIVCTAKNGICQTFIYGMNEDVEYQVELQDQITEVIPYTTKEVKTNELAKGETAILQKGVNGYKSEAYRIIKLNGATISKTLLSKDSYNALEEIIQVGTK